MPEAHPVLSIPNLLGLETLGIEFIGPYPAGEIWLSPELRLIHGDLVRQGGGATAKAILRDSECSTIYEHIHRFELAVFVGSTVLSRHNRHATIGSKGCTG